MGGAQQEDEKDSIDQQAIFDGVVSFLPALTRLLFRRVLGADDPPFRPVMGTRGASGVVAVLYPRTFSTDLDVLFDTFHFPLTLSSHFQARFLSAGEA